MAVTFSNTLGTLAQSLGGAGSGNISTTNAVASNEYVIVLAHRFSSVGGTITVSGGGLTWTNRTVTSGNLRMNLAYALAPSGLSAGTNLNVALSAQGDITACAGAYAGIDTSSPERAVNSGSGSGTAWTVTVAGNSGDAYIGGSGGDGTLRTSTPTAPAVERVDFNNAGTSGSVTLADTLSGGASDTLAGTWSGTLTHLRIAAAFIPAAGGGAPAPRMLGSLGVGT